MEDPDISYEKKADADVENTVPSSLKTKSKGPIRKWFRGLFTRVKKAENV